MTTRTLDDKSESRSREPSPDECIDHDAAIDPVLLWRELVQCYAHLYAANELLREQYHHSNIEIERGVMRAQAAVRNADRAMGRNR